MIGWPWRRPRFIRLPHAGDMPEPQRASRAAAGWDLRVACDFTLEPGARALAPTGFALAMPAGTEAQVRPRSGLAARDGVRVFNAPGTIDADYEGEILVLLENAGDEPFIAARGTRIAQLVFARVAPGPRASPARRVRGAAGFGSTGAK